MSIEARKPGDIFYISPEPMPSGFFGLTLVKTSRLRCLALEARMLRDDVQAARQATAKASQDYRRTHGELTVMTKRYEESEKANAGLRDRVRNLREQFTRHEAAELARQEAKGP
jgi:hypothetical protein